MLKEGYILGGRLFSVEYQYSDRGDIISKHMEQISTYIEDIQIDPISSVYGTVLYDEFTYELFAKFEKSR